MGTLLLILLVLFVALALVVKMTEKHGKPMEPGQWAKLSKILMALVFASIVISLIQHAMHGGL